MNQETRGTLAGLLAGVLFFGGWICTFLFIFLVYEDDECTSYHSGARPDSPAWEVESEASQFANPYGD